MPYFTITLPLAIADKLKEDQDKTGIKRSTLIAQYLEQHYTTVPALEYETKIQELTANYKAKIQELEKAQEEQKVQYTVELQELNAELQRVQAETKAETLQKAASQDAVVKGLQNELEIVKTEAKNLADKLSSNTSTINELKADKEYFKKQLELVTLRLPAPKVGLWAKIFGSKKEKEND